MVVAAGMLTAISTFARINGVARRSGFREEDADPEELTLGIKEEMEHTGDLSVAKEIALDHLSEDPRYYTKLKAIGL
jgi:hypothetical protein